VTEAPGVRRATRADLSTVAGVLAEAFDDDPVMTWLLPHAARRRTPKLHRFFSIEARGFFRHEKPVYIAANGSGAALWAPPGAWRLSRAENAAEALPRAAIFTTRLPHASRLATELDELHPAQSHWYLYLLGTRAASQGRGVGSALLRAALTVVDAAGEPAYLESSNHRNVSLYERHGFRVIHEVTISGGGPTMWLMWRPASR
jgi:ribosomal protein S18 acetylase RimI-like enzyme